MAIDAHRATGVSAGNNADAQIKTGPGTVYWVAVSAGATGGLFHLRDGTSDSGALKLSILMPATTTQFFGPFDPPIECATGIRLDAPGTNLLVTVCYT